MTNDRMNVEIGDRELIFTRTFDAPRQLVFETFSSCEHLSNWWGPRQWPMAECTLDFREGGVWHYCLRGPNEGDESWGQAVYDEIVEPERIVYTDHFADSDGNVNSEMPAVKTTIQFDRQNGKTTLRVRAQYPSASDLKQVVEMGMIEGMNETLDRLEEHVASLVKS